MSATGWDVEGGCMNNGQSFESMVLTALFLFMYFLPAIVASSRKHNNATAIGVLNLFLGWTMIGWIGSMVWAFTSNTKRKVMG
jgi:hypothetical protein